MKYMFRIRLPLNTSSSVCSPSAPICFGVSEIGSPYSPMKNGVHVLYFPYTPLVLGGKTYSIFTHFLKRFEFRNTIGPTVYPTVYPTISYFKRTDSYVCKIYLSQQNSRNKFQVEKLTYIIILVSIISLYRLYICILCRAISFFAISILISLCFYGCCFINECFDNGCRCFNSG